MNKLKFLKNIFPVFILPILISCGGGGGGDSTPAPIPTYTITASAGDNGAISPISVTVNEGQTASFNISPDNGYIVSSASGCNGTLTDNTFIELGPKYHASELNIIKYLYMLIILKYIGQCI